MSIRRREFITLLGGVVAAWPMGARAQQAVPVIGVLGASSPDLRVNLFNAFRQGLGETGYVEGRDVAIEFHLAENQFDRFPPLAADLGCDSLDVGLSPNSGHRPSLHTIKFV